MLPPNQRPSTPGGISVPTPGWVGGGGGGGRLSCRRFSPPLSRIFVDKGDPDFRLYCRHALPCQRAACFPATSLARRASGGFRVLATARHTRVCLRVAVLHKSPRCAAAVRLTAANQAAFGIIECVRRCGAAFFTRARSDGVFSRAIRGEEASPGVVALLLRCASKRRF